LYKVGVRTEIQCNNVVVLSRSFSKPAADAERPSDSREKWAASD
jgi:hypothetical protein